MPGWWHLRPGSPCRDGRSAGSRVSQVSPAGNLVAATERHVGLDESLPPRAPVCSRVRDSSSYRLGRLRIQIHGQRLASPRPSGEPRAEGCRGLISGRPDPVLPAAAPPAPPPSTFWMTSAPCLTPWLTSWTPCWTELDPSAASGSALCDPQHPLLLPQHGRGSCCSKSVAVSTAVLEGLPRGGPGEPVRTRHLSETHSQGVT